jgi:hypothetical protein
MCIDPHMWWAPKVSPAFSLSWTLRPRMRISKHGPTLVSPCLRQEATCFRFLPANVMIFEQTIMTISIYIICVYIYVYICTCVYDHPNSKKVWIHKYDAHTHTHPHPHTHLHMHQLLRRCLDTHTNKVWRSHRSREVKKTWWRLMKTEWKLNASLRVTGRQGRQRLDHWEVRLCARSRLAQLRESWHSNKWRGKRDILRIFVYGFVSCLQDMLLRHFVCIPIHFYSPITIATQFYLLGEKATAWVEKEHFSSCWRTSTLGPLGYPLLICSIQSRSRRLIFFDWEVDEVDARAEYGCNCQPSRSRWSPSTWIHGFGK